MNVAWLKNITFLAVCGAAMALLFVGLQPGGRAASRSDRAVSFAKDSDFDASLAAVNASFVKHWKDAGITPAERADDLTLARRAALALVGSSPSVEEIREFEARPQEERLSAWIDYLLADPRSSDFLAERLARAYVGVDTTPFIIFRRKRFVGWLASELRENRPYDQIVRELLTSSGLWTDNPATNFLTVTIQPEDKNRPDEQVLAARVSRAFLGKRIDCAQCHDHPFQSWKQSDFEGLAAWFGQVQYGFTGITDGGGELEVEDREYGTKHAVAPRVPFEKELASGDGPRREQLAAWVTHPENKAFSRAIVNKLWAILFSQPLVSPLDDIPDDLPAPMLDTIAVDFSKHGFDIRRAIRLMALSDAFARESRIESDAAGRTIDEMSQLWAAFPVSPLRPEQMVGAILQACSLTTIDYDSHIFTKISRYNERRDFIQRYGDLGVDEFQTQPATIAQELLLMNGELIHDRTADNIVMNAATRIAALAPTDALAVETAYLAALSRRPTPEEAKHFEGRLKGTRDDARRVALADLYWTLLNSTEFALNH